jgi:hypothetical protein
VVADNLTDVLVEQLPTPDMNSASRLQTGCDLYIPNASILTTRDYLSNKYCAASLLVESVTIPEQLLTAFTDDKIRRPVVK